MSRVVGRPTVLVVDDNPEFLDILRAILDEQGLGFCVTGIESGTGALAFLEQRGQFVDPPAPDLIVLDFRLPDINAPAVLRSIREVERLRSIPVLVLSQANWHADEAAALEAGATAFQVKPSHVARLREIFVNFWNTHGHVATYSLD